MRAHPGSSGLHRSRRHAEWRRRRACHLGADHLASAANGAAKRRVQRGKRGSGEAGKWDYLRKRLRSGGIDRREASPCSFFLPSFPASPLKLWIWLELHPCHFQRRDPHRARPASRPPPTPGSRAMGPAHATTLRRLRPSKSGASLRASGRNACRSTEIGRELSIAVRRCSAASVPRCTARANGHMLGAPGVGVAVNAQSMNGRLRSTPFGRRAMLPGAASASAAPVAAPARARS